MFTTRQTHLNGRRFAVWPRSPLACASDLERIVPHERAATRLDYRMVINTHDRARKSHKARLAHPPLRTRCPRVESVRLIIQPVVSN